MTIWIDGCGGPRPGASRFRSAPGSIGVSLAGLFLGGLLPSRARFRFARH